MHTESVSCLMHALKRLGLHVLLWIVCVAVVITWYRGISHEHERAITGLFLFPVLLILFLGYMAALGMDGIMYTCCKDKAH